MQPVLWSQDHGNVLLRPQSTLIADHAGLKHDGSHWPGESCPEPHLVIPVHPDIDPVHWPHLDPALGTELVPGPHLGLPGRPRQARRVWPGLHSGEPPAAVLLVVLSEREYCQYDSLHQYNIELSLHLFHEDLLITALAVELCFMLCQSGWSQTFLFTLESN